MYICVKDVILFIFSVNIVSMKSFIITTIAFVTEFIFLALLIFGRLKQTAPLLGFGLPHGIWQSFVAFIFA